MRLPAPPALSASTVDRWQSIWTVCLRAAGHRFLLHLVTHSTVTWQAPPQGQLLCVPRTLAPRCGKDPLSYWLAGFSHRKIRELSPWITRSVFGHLGAKAVSSPGLYPCARGLCRGCLRLGSCHSTQAGVGIAWTVGVETRMGFLTLQNQSRDSTHTGEAAQRSLSSGRHKAKARRSSSSRPPERL